MIADSSGSNLARKVILSVNGWAVGLLCPPSLLHTESSLVFGTLIVFQRAWKNSCSIVFRNHSFSLFRGKLYFLSCYDQFRAKLKILRKYCCIGTLRTTELERNELLNSSKPISKIPRDFIFGSPIIQN